MDQQFGNYRLIRKLGSGGFADVYQAQHIYLNTLAAVKLLTTNLANGDMQNFHEEAKTIAHLMHPYIVRVLDFGVERTIPYLVMEYAPNGTLRQRHPKGTPIPFSLVLTYVRQVASALQYAHTQRLIHRDVKPENLLLGRNNEILLGDFGAALITRTSLLLTTQNIIGTVSYMAPEQLQGKPSPASDQYSLAIVVYEWLCGYCPFHGSLAELHNLQLYAPPPPLHARIPTISSAVEQVIMKALAKQPEQRFVTIQAFYEALEQANRPIQAPASPLFLPGNAGSPDQRTFMATEAIYAPPPLPPTQVTPLPASSFPETIIANNAPPAKSGLSRRVFLISLLGLAAIGGAGAGALISAQSAGPSTPTLVPTPTPIPTKTVHLYTYTGHKDQVFTAAWSPDGKRVASAGGNIGVTRQGDTRVHVWEAQIGHQDVQTGQDVYLYTGHSKLVRKVAWSPNSMRIASASEDATVQVWDATTGNNPVIYTGHTGTVMSVTWSPDGTRIASASKDKTVQIWDADTGSNILTCTGHTKWVTAVAWSLDGTRIASTSEDKTVIVWDATTGNQLHNLLHTTTVGSVAWSPDSKYIVTGDYNDDDSVRIWNVDTASNVRVFPGTPGNLVYAVDWSLDNKYIAAGYQKNQVKVWHLTTSTATDQVLTYFGHTQPIMSVQWSHNGKYIASCGFDGTVQLWTLA